MCFSSWQSNFDESLSLKLVSLQMDSTKISYFHSASQFLLLCHYFFFQARKFQGQNLIKNNVGEVPAPDVEVLAMDGEVLDIGW